MRGAARSSHVADGWMATRQPWAPAGDRRRPTLELPAVRLALRLSRGTSPNGCLWA